MATFYHHTDPAYLASIMEVGLLARPWGGSSDPTLSAILHHRSIVWLTTQPTAILSEADIKFLRQRGRGDEAATGIWLNRNGGNLLRLRINVSEHSKKLHHYRSWVKANDAMIVDQDGNGRCNAAGEIWTTAGHLKDCMPSMSRWFIYFGDISPKKITPG